MTKQPIPDAALDDRLFFGGTAGSGKTYNAMSRVERLLARKSRVVIPDPLGVWWGLRLSADGKRPSGHDVVIFGGPHGDLPLTEAAGALIGETVAGMKESCILDLSQLGTKASERRFMLAFLTALYKHTTGEPLHVVFDEADMWAPQKLLDKDGDAARLLGMMETIVRRGRVKGFIPWLISQRPAVITKDILSQADGIVAFKLTSSQDRKAIEAWVEGQADAKTWDKMSAQLPMMERGQGLVWIPGRDILDVVQFPEKETFDSSRTPKRGERLKRTAALKPIDLGAVKGKLSTVEAETKANDPKALRAENAKLRTEVATLTYKSTTPAAPAKPDKNAIAAAEKRGFEQAVKKLAGASERAQRKALKTTLGMLRGYTQKFVEQLDGELEAVNFREAQAEKVTFSPSAAPVQQQSRPPAQQKTTSAPPRVPGPPSAGGTALPTGAKKMLAVIDVNPPVRRSWGQVATLAGLKARGGSFNTARKALTESGLLLEQNGLIQIAAPTGDPVPEMEPADLVQMWTAKLSGAAPRILQAIFDAGGSKGQVETAEGLGIQPRGGSWNTAWKELRDNEIITVSGGHATLTELFMPR